MSLKQGLKCTIMIHNLINKKMKTETSSLGHPLLGKNALTESILMALLKGIHLSSRHWEDPMDPKDVPVKSRYF